VQTLISRLRKAVGERVETVTPGYLLRVHAGELDLDRARSLIEEAAAADDPRRRRSLLREAQSQWRGEPLSGLDFPFVALEREALAELRATATEARIAADLDDGVDVALLPELSALVAREPLRERFRELLMLALYRAGRQSEALDVYRDARRMLHDELGLEAGPELRRLEQAILRQDPSLMPARRVRLRRSRSWKVALFAAGAATALVLPLAKEVSHGQHRAPMRPFARTTVAALAAAPIPAGWTTIRDGFSHNRLSPALWDTFGSGSGASLRLQSDRLDVVLAPDGRVGGRFRQIGAGVFSVCRFNGDFDARIDYRLLDWPTRSGARAQLSAWIFPNRNSDAARESALPGERVDGDMPKSHNLLYFADRSGTLRLLRRAGRMVALAWHKRHWVALDAEHDVGQVQLGINLWADSSDWAHRRVEAAFDNFRASAPHMTCG
jgi:DNA-binding SARP family transcriptional activator